MVETEDLHLRKKRGLRFLLLVIDLDGTCIRSDLLRIGLKHFLISNPFRIAFVLYCTFMNRRFLLKKIVAENTVISIEKLETNRQVIEFCEKEFAQGRKIVILTGAYEKVAEQVALLFPFVSSVHGSSDGINLTKVEKLKLMRNLYPNQKYEYIGDSTDDFAIMSFAEGVYLVGNNKILEGKLSNIKGVFNT
jgi:hypothetical protein